jgi:hypothetical protein
MPQQPSQNRLKLEGRSGSEACLDFPSTVAFLRGDRSDSLSISFAPNPIEITQHLWNSLLSTARCPDLNSLEFT